MIWEWMPSQISASHLILGLCSLAIQTSTRSRAVRQSAISAIRAGNAVSAEEKAIRAASQP
jgi:hypothetical protein